MVQKLVNERGVIGERQDVSKGYFRVIFSFSRSDLYLDLVHAKQHMFSFQFEDF